MLRSGPHVCDVGRCIQDFMPTSLEQLQYVSEFVYMQYVPNGHLCFMERNDVY